MSCTSPSVSGKDTSVATLEGGSQEDCLERVMYPQHGEGQSYAQRSKRLRSACSSAACGKCSHVLAPPPLPR